MTESRWMRLNIDWDDSPWLFTLSAESQLAWIKLLCHVKRDGRGGKVKALATIVAAKKWGVGEEAVVKLLQAAVNDGALESNGETWVITNWEKYQGSDPTNAERQKRYRNARNKSPEVFERDGYACRHCGATDELVVDHIVPTSKGGDTALSNLQTLCRSCNAAKRDKTDRNAVTNVVPVVRDSDSDRDKRKNIKKEKFRPPSVEDVQGYAAERDLVDDPSLEAEKFVAYHTSRGWVVGRNPMRDWRAAWRTWEINNRKSAGEQPRRRHFA